MAPIAQDIFAIVCAVLASSGFWVFLSQKAGKKDSIRKMLVGLGHDRIIYLGMLYIERGCITEDEYENLYEYLYKPYEELGGNGAAKRVIQEVQRLPLVKSLYDMEDVHNESK